MRPRNSPYLPLSELPGPPSGAWKVKSPIVYRENQPPSRTNWFSLFPLFGYLPIPQDEGKDQI